MSESCCVGFLTLGRGAGYPAQRVGLPGLHGRLSEALRRSGATPLPPAPRPRARGAGYRRLLASRPGRAKSAEFTRRTKCATIAALVPGGVFWRFMMKRFSVNKGKSAAQFRANTRRTKAANINAVMRGGIRL